MLDSEADIRRKLERIQQLIADYTRQLDKLEAARDSLIRQLCDTQGCDARRMVVR